MNFCKDTASIMPRYADIHEGIDTAFITLQSQLKQCFTQNKILIDREYGDLPKIECFTEQINQVFIDILKKLIIEIEASIQNQMLKNPQIAISTYFESDQNFYERVVIYISGNGISKLNPVQDCRFENFLTEMSMEHEHEVDLAVSYQVIVENHGGTLVCDYIPDGGVEYIIILPCHQTSIR